MAYTKTFGEVLRERIEALQHLVDQAPEYPPHLFGPGDGLDEWEGASTRLEVWLNDTVSAVSKYDTESAAHLKSIFTSHVRCDPEEDFRRDSAKYMALLSALAAVPERARLPPREPAVSAGGRVKDQKFGILDAPRQQERDLADALGVLGVALIYLDIDHFKRVNTTFTERVVDKTILPQFQRLVDEAARGHGYAYAEGGDEVVVLLPNFSLSMAVGFATELRRLVRSTPFTVESRNVSLTISAGLATASTAAEAADLAEHANLAKHHAKEQGRDRVSVWTRAGCRPAPAMSMVGDEDVAAKPQPAQPTYGTLDELWEDRERRKRRERDNE